jgi:hypothetical protein
MANDKKKEQILADAAKDVSSRKQAYDMAYLQSVYAGVKAEQSTEAIKANETIIREQETILKTGLTENTRAKKEYLFKQGDRAAGNLLAEIQRLRKATENLMDSSAEIQSAAEKTHEKLRDYAADNVDSGVKKE